MKIVVINGQNHKGSTYNIGKILCDKLNGEVTEFFLNRDFSEFCCGCTNCIMKSETKCPHFEKLEPITKAIDEADVLIFTSPVYVCHCTGAMKALLDHYAYRWFLHRPNGNMCRKQAVVISTGAGGGMKSTNKDISDSFYNWGVGRIYSFGYAVRATSWDNVSEKTKHKVYVKTSAVAEKISRCVGKVHVTLKFRFVFILGRIMNKSSFNKADSDYWHEMGWTEKKRPWKSN